MGDGLYHDGWRITLDALSLCAIVFLWGKWLEIAFFAATLHLFARNGTSDILYYWLDGRAIPQRIDWLDANQFIPFKPVTGETLVLSSVIWIAAWVLVWLVVGRLTFRFRGSPTSSI